MAMQQIPIAQAQGARQGLVLAGSKNALTKAQNAIKQNKYIKVTQTGTESKAGNLVVGTPRAIIKNLLKKDPVTGQLLRPDFAYSAFTEVPKGYQYPANQISWHLFRMYGRQSDIDRELVNFELPGGMRLSPDIIQQVRENMVTAQNIQSKYPQLLQAYQQAEETSRRGRESRGDFLKVITSLITIGEVSRQLAQQGYNLGGRRGAKTKAEDVEKSKGRGGLVKQLRKAVQGGSLVDVSVLQPGNENKGMKGKGLKRARWNVSAEDLARIQQGQPAGSAKVGILNAELPLVSNNDERWDLAMQILAYTTGRPDYWLPLVGKRGQSIANPQDYTAQAVLSVLPKDTRTARQQGAQAAGQQTMLYSGATLPGLGATGAINQLPTLGGVQYQQSAAAPLLPQPLLQTQLPQQTQYQQTQPQLPLLPPQQTQYQQPSALPLLGAPTQRGSSPATQLGALPTIGLPQLPVSTQLPVTQVQTQLGATQLGTTPGAGAVFDPLASGIGSRFGGFPGQLQPRTPTAGAAGTFTLGNPSRLPQ